MKKLLVLLALALLFGSCAKTTFIDADKIHKDSQKGFDELERN